jgi:hypothetical protein
MKSHSHLRYSILFLALALVQLALGFDYPLSPEAIREAYFLGNGNPEKRAEFFAKYTHHLPMPKDGPNIASIEVDTPFACVVDAVAHKLLGYHAPDAEHDFLGKPGCFRVRVEIYFTPTYPDPTATAPVLGDFWRDFKVHLKQDTDIAPRSAQGQPIYSDQTISGYRGADLLLDYDVKKINQATPVTIEVIVPGGHEAETTFDLGSLR